MKAQGLLTLVYVAAVLAYAAADRDVSPFISTLLINDRGCHSDRRAGITLADMSRTLLDYTQVFAT